jgi:hypothetical protein
MGLVTGLRVHDVRELAAPAYQSPTPTAARTRASARPHHQCRSKLPTTPIGESHNTCLAWAGVTGDPCTVPACKFGTGEVTQALQGIEAGGGSERDLELILVRARGATGGQQCALPTGESLLMQSLVQAFGEEFGSHIGRSCPLPRELSFHKIVDWDATAGRFAYDLAYADKQPDWTSPS